LPTNHQTAQESSEEAALCQRHTLSCGRGRQGRTQEEAGHYGRVVSNGNVPSSAIRSRRG
jgi:hypothetical protein